MIDEGLLEGMKGAIRVFQPLDGGYFPAICLYGKGDAGFDRFPIEKDSTRSTFTQAASFFRSGQLQIFAKELQEGPPGLHLCFVREPVHC
jgi:hypothetical protein